MKLTNKFISTISEERRQKHNDGCKSDYYKHQDRYKFLAKMNYYKAKFGRDTIQKFVDKYGFNEECIKEIKKATKKTIQVDIETPV